MGRGRGPGYYDEGGVWVSTGTPKRRRSGGGNPRTSNDFGTGEVGGDNSWTAPVYSNTGDGQDVTVSFGQGSREGHTGIASGHVSGNEYYSEGGHDHYGRDGESHRDSGRYQD